eukprot:CAMPEP_0175065296 /NCGR_PEP_ID=MMETSP0052_2-20121109/15839_1 /TAXON_ID=51329 ORGANISM="Polytomella parva, Strain SAG 63-3" /NCGR_SAMPLE_ID=MMETSP0052_2 /ASSEMBLY_ACC=CAM_ASM_000194 /LENGTH=195 /DNA_ID=CAMNT_0016331801 /DNA_START=96 /DNA_END=680 /DNA_ORIENTATION=+
MSDYEEEDFEEYDEDDFENEDDYANETRNAAGSDDDYDVIPSVGRPPPAPFSMANRPPYFSPSSPMPRPISQSSSRPMSRGLDLPSANGSSTVVFAPSADPPPILSKLAAQKLALSLSKWPAVRPRLSEVAQHDLWSAAPQSKYELFQMARSNYKSLRPGSTQTQDDGLEEESQTEEVERATCSCQAPDDLSSSG